MASLLRAAGYRTAVIGKWGLGGPGTTGQPDKQGFDHSFGFLDHRHAHRQYTDHLYRNAKRVAVDLERDYVNDLFTREAESFIGTSDARPFFLYLNYTVPHAELRVPEDSLAPLRGKFPETPFVNPKADAVATGATIDGPSIGYRSQPTPRAAFVAMIQRMDRDIGRLVDLIDSRKIGGNTLILFTSDNGPHREGGADPEFFKSSGPLRGIKRDLYEGGIRVPMVARWSGTIPAARVSYHEWAHWDILPTLTELAGAKTPSGLDGLSMARALRGEQQPTHAVLLLGVPRARLPAGGADGRLEGGAVEEGRAARALRPARRPARSARSRGRQSRRCREDREVSEHRADGIGALACQVGSKLPPPREALRRTRRSRGEGGRGMIMRARVVAAALFAVGVIGPAGPGVRAQTSKAPAWHAEVDRVFATWDRRDSPGCALAVYKDDRIVYERGYGMADLEHDIRISPATVFYAGSVSKQFTAFAAALAIQQGRLQLDDSIRKFLPELPPYADAITIRHLCITPAVCATSTRCCRLPAAGRTRSTTTLRSSG